MDRIVGASTEIKGDVFVVLRHVGLISGVATHEDGYIATAGDDGRVILWEKATGKLVNSSFHDDAVNDCAFSRDSRYLVTSSSDCTARLWSVPDLSPKAALVDHGDDVTMSVFHPADELIATASRDYFVRVYAFDARLVARFGGSDGDVAWLDWTHDGRQLVSLSADGEIKRWAWATKQPVQEQAVVVKGKQATCVGEHDKRLVIDPRKSLLASVSDGTLGVWDISSATPTPIAATTLPGEWRADTWRSRRCRRCPETCCAPGRLLYSWVCRMPDATRAHQLVDRTADALTPDGRMIEGDFE